MFGSFLRLGRCEVDDKVSITSSLEPGYTSIDGKCLFSHVQDTIFEKVHSEKWRNSFGFRAVKHNRAKFRFVDKLHRDL
jgi:hypothetical protein